MPTWPSTPVLREVVLRTNWPTLRSRTDSGKRLARQIAGQFWGMTAVYPPMTRAQFQPIRGFIMARGIGLENFTIVPPHLATPLGDVSGSTPLVNGASQTGTSLITDGWKASTTVLKAGDTFKLAGHVKVYEMTADAVSDGAGNATLNFGPALFATPADGEALVVTAVPFTMAIAANAQEFPTDVHSFYSYEVDMEEDA